MSELNKTKYQTEKMMRAAKYIVLAAMLYMPLFGHLDALPLRLWDESRLAMSAYEMYKNGNYLIVHYDGAPDMWSTKPPLLIWIQTLFIKLLGVNVLAVRLPSAFAALATCAVILFFFRQYLKQFWFGFIAILVLITSAGYVRMHGVRTADYDSLLTLFTTASGLLFFAYCETNNKKHLYLFFLVITLAVLTKGVAGLLFVPALIIYSILQKQLFPLLKSKHFYVGLASFLIIVLGYYLLREHYNPGYIHAVWLNELGGRYMEALEGHGYGFWHYYDYLIQDHFSFWYLFIPFGIFISIVTKDKKVQRIGLFSSLMALTFFLIISSGQTKLDWYDMPMYPFLAIICAVFIHYLFSLIAQSSSRNDILSFNPYPFLFLIIIGFAPYQFMFSKTYMPQEKEDEERAIFETGRFLQGLVKGHYDSNHQFFVMDGYHPNWEFYLKVLNNKGVEIARKNWKNLAIKDIALVSQDPIKEYIESHYLQEKIDMGNGVSRYQIMGVVQK